MGVNGAATKNILNEERRPAGGSSVLTCLSLLLLAGGLHLFFPLGARDCCKTVM